MLLPWALVQLLLSVWESSPEPVVDAVWPCRPVFVSGQRFLLQRLGHLAWLEDPRAEGREADVPDLGSQGCGWWGVGD